MGCVFHVIAGIAGVSANIGGATVSYEDGWVSALISSARPAAPLRVPASAIASGVRYEYPTHPMALFPDPLGASARRTWLTVEAMSFRYGAVPIATERRYWLSFAKSFHSSYIRCWFASVSRL